MSTIIKLGTRPSKLAIIQAEQVKKKLTERFPNLLVEIVSVKTEGDIDQTSSLKQLGGKGVFIKAIEQKLLNKEIDAAIHSFKDITANIADNTQLISFLKPESTSDCVVFKSSKIKSLNDLKKNSIVATSSLRRKLYIKQYFPKLKVIDIRGNVETRIKKCKSGFSDAVILSTAGLMRLNVENDISEILDPNHFVPAPGQGVVTVQSHKNDELNKYLKVITDPQQHFISNLEYLFLKVVGLDCNYPLGLRINILKNKVRIAIKWASEDMENIHEKKYECDTTDAQNEIEKLANFVKEHV